MEASKRVILSRPNGVQIPGKTVARQREWGTGGRACSLGLHSRHQAPPGRAGQEGTVAGQEVWAWPLEKMQQHKASDWVQISHSPNPGNSS